jgi:Domain of unknown function (DUF6431)
VLMVDADVAVVEARLMAGLLTGPCCGGRLGPWGFARARSVRGVDGELVALRPRRARCRGCPRTHVLLPDVCLLGRQYVVMVIGAALLAKLGGLGHREIARRLAVPADTVRSWLRRFGARAEPIRAHFTRWAVTLDPTSRLLGTGSAVGDALGAIGMAAEAWSGRFGQRPLWRLVAGLSGGVLLATPGRLFPAVP